jgi:hypothetical protein
VATTNRNFKVKHGLDVTEGGTFGGTVTVATPTLDTHAATKAYVDANAGGGGSPGTATIYRYKYTATGSETSKSGADDNGLTLAYTVGKEQVYLNGVLLLRTTDYTATNGTSISGLAALASGDVLEVITFSPFELANVIEPTLFDAKGDLLVATSADVPGRLAVGANGYFLRADSSAATGMAWSEVQYETTGNADIINKYQDIVIIMGAY